MNFDGLPKLRRNVTCGPLGPSRRAVLAAGLPLGLPLGMALGLAGQARAAGWDDVLREGRGQEVSFHAWDGDERTNAFIAWAGRRVRELHGVELRHVRLRDVSETVARLAADRAAGKLKGGAVDLVWVDGSNLAAMRDAGLLDGPVLDLLPTARLVDRAGKPSTVMDRMVPVDGYAVPWRLAQIVFIYDSRSNADPPPSMAGLLDSARRRPGRLTHLHVRDALGTAFLEQALYELVGQPDRLRHPIAPAEFAKASAPLWDWYDRLRPALWQGGRQFPASLASQRSLMKAGQIDLMISFNPSEAVISIAAGALPASARAYVLEGGTIGKCSFLAVPFNAGHRAGALLVADFLLSPEAQARASDPRFVGVPSVLAMDRLSAADYVFFDAVPRNPDLLSDAERGNPLPEPHVSWVNQMIAGWEARYAG